MNKKTSTASSASAAASAATSTTAAGTENEEEDSDCEDLAHALVEIIDIESEEGDNAAGTLAGPQGPESLDGVMAALQTALNEPILTE